MFRRNRRLRSVVRRVVPQFQALETRDVPAFFTPGNFIVTRVGEGTNPLSPAATQVYLDEYDQAGNWVQTIDLPTLNNGNQRAFTLSGTNAREGDLNRSSGSNGDWLVLAGYAVSPGLGNVADTTSSAVNRVVAVVDIDGNVDTSTAFDDGLSRMSPVGVATDEATRFWVAGTSDSQLQAEVRYLAELGADTSLQISKGGPSSPEYRSIGIATDQLYATFRSNSTAFPKGLARDGTGLPINGPQTLTGVVTLDQPGDFVLLDRDPNIPGDDSLYIIDQRTPSSGGGLLKYSFTGTHWLARGSVSGPGVLRGLTSRILVNGAVELLTISGTGAGNQPFRLVDTASYNTGITGNFSEATYGWPNMAMRGISFVPGTRNAVNGQPTLDWWIDPVTMSEDDVTAVTLTGITDGDGGIQNLTITAWADNGALLPDLTLSSVDRVNKTATLTLRPGANLSGATTVYVMVQDHGGTANGGSDTIIRSFDVTVLPANDPPTLNPINPVTVVAGSAPLTIPLTGIGPLETGQAILQVLAASSHPGLVGVSVQYAPSSPTGGLTLTNFGLTGAATITVTVRDNGGTDNGGIDTFTRTFTVNVNPPPNLQPTLDALGGLSLREDDPEQVISLANLSTGGETGQTLTITTASNNPTLIPTPTIAYTNPQTTGTLKLRPLPNQSGTATITVTVRDNGGLAFGGSDTIVRTFVVTVDPVNDTPTLAAIPDQTMLEDAVERSLTLTGITDGGDGKFPLTITAFSDNAALIPNPLVLYTSPANLASLRFQPRPGRWGTATITVTVRDDGGTANGGIDTVTRTFTVAVQPVNDEPTSNLSMNVVSVLEDAGPVAIAGLVRDASVGSDEEAIAGQGIRLEATLLGTTGGLTFTSAPTLDPDGTLRFTTTPNTSGTASVRISAIDDGPGTAPDRNRNDKTLTITVGGVNDAPLFELSRSELTIRDQDLPSIMPGFAQAISSGPPDESGQGKTFDVSALVRSGNLALADLAINPDGTLIVRPVPGTSGTAEVTVVLRDDGPAEGPNRNLSTARTFVLTVQPRQVVPTDPVATMTLLQFSKRNGRKGAVTVRLTATILPLGVTATKPGGTVQFQGVGFAARSVSVVNGMAELVLNLKRKPAKLSATATYSGDPAGFKTSASPTVYVFGKPPKKR